MADEGGRGRAAGIVFVRHGGGADTSSKKKAGATKGGDDDRAAPAALACATGSTPARAVQFLTGALSAQTKAAANRIQELLDRGTTVCSRTALASLVSAPLVLAEIAHTLLLPAAWSAGDPARRKAARLQRPE